MITQRGGISIRPGLIHLGARTSLAPQSLAARATAAETARKTYIIIGVVCLISLILIGIFCAVVLCLMHKKKRQRQKAHLDLSASRANHAYQPVHNMELQYTGVQEMPAENTFGGGGKQAELHGDFNEVAKTHQLDGFVAPPKPSARPAELPSNNSYRDTYNR